MQPAKRISPLDWLYLPPIAILLFMYFGGDVAKANMHWLVHVCWIYGVFLILKPFPRKNNRFNSLNRTISILLVAALIIFAFTMWYSNEKIEKSAEALGAKYRSNLARYNRDFDEFTEKLKEERKKQKAELDSQSGATNGVGPAGDATLIYPQGSIVPTTVPNRNTNVRTPVVILGPDRDTSGGGGGGGGNNKDREEHESLM